MPNKPVTIAWHTTKAQYDEDRPALAAAGLKVGTAQPLPTKATGMVEAQFVEALVVPLVGALKDIVMGIVGHWLKRQDRGLFMDLSQTPPVVSDLMNFPRGVLLVKGPDGKTTSHHVKNFEAKAMAELLGRILAPVAGP